MNPVKLTLREGLAGLSALAITLGGLGTILGSAPGLYALQDISAQVVAGGLLGAVVVYLLGTFDEGRHRHGD